MQLNRMLPQQQSAAADTARAADTASLAERLRGGAPLQDLPAQVNGFVEQLRTGVTDTALWVGVAGLILKVLLIIVLAVIVLRLIDRLAARWTRRVEELPPSHPRRERVYTVSNLLASTGRYVVWPIATIMILSEVGVEVGALLATAGIAGLAIGFGAQTLVKDVISGIFLLFDDTIHVGDLVYIGAEAGSVEEIGIRLIKVRKFDGELLMVPAGELRIFGNRSIGFARAIVEVGLSYEQDVDTILPVMERVASEWAEDHRDILLEDEPTVQGLTQFGASAVTARIFAQVRPGEQYNAELDLRMRLKRAFDELGIEIPFDRRTIYVRREEAPPPREIQPPRLSSEGSG